jgi:hypothetical protein
MLTVNVVNEAGYDQALEGLSYNKEQKLENMQKVLEKLAPLDGGHNKVLRMMQVWVVINASRFFWVEFDTYKVGTTASSQSTMHSIHKRPLIKDDFENGDISQDKLDELNAIIDVLKKADTYDLKQEALIQLKRSLPEGFMQKRMVNLNYAALRNIILQRRNHRLPHWQIFVKSILEQVKHPELLPKLKD